MRLMCVALSVVLAGCAARSGYQPKREPTKNLSAFIATSAIGVVDGTCLMEAALKNGEKVRVPLKMQICRDAEYGLAIEQSVRQQMTPKSEAPKPEPVK